MSHLFNFPFSKDDRNFNAKLLAETPAMFYCLILLFYAICAQSLIRSLKSSITFVKMIFLFVLVVSIRTNAQNIKVFQAPSVVYSMEKIDYGNIYYKSDGIRTIKVSNIGSAPLVVTSCISSCGCTRPSCPTTPILPGTYSQISVYYDTKKIGPIDKYITITTNDPNRPTITIPLTGNVLLRKE